MLSKKLKTRLLSKFSDQTTEVLEIRGYLNRIKQLTGQGRTWLYVGGKGWCIKRKTMFLQQLVFQGKLESDRGMLGECSRERGSLAPALGQSHPQWGTGPSHCRPSHIIRVHPDHEGSWRSFVPLCPSTYRERRCRLNHMGERVLVRVTDPVLILNFASHILAYSSIPVNLVVWVSLPQTSELKDLNKTEVPSLYGREGLLLGWGVFPKVIPPVKTLS